MVNLTVHKTVVLLIKIGLSLVGAYLSYEHCAAYWYVGPIFGVVILVWYAQSLREIATLRCLAFLVASTLIYAFVYWLSDKLSNSNYGLYVAVGAGTILLPLAHKLFLTASWRRIVITVPSLYGFWYVLSTLVGELGLGGLVEKLVNMVSIWQVLYLIFLFYPVRLAVRRDNFFIKKSY